MPSKFLCVSMLVLLSLMISGIFIGIAECNSQSILWTTDATGKAEVDQFQLGDTVYIKSTLALNMHQSKYMVYVFVGNVLNEGVTSGSYPDLSSFPKPANFVPIEIVTDIDGKLSNPVEIWSHATYGEFTVVLDYLGSFDGSGRVFSAATAKSFNSQTDYRDDVCSSAEKLHSLNVVPEPATIAAVTMMFGAFASFFVVKRKMTYRK